jgi:aminomethyltransferase
MALAQGIKKTPLNAAHRRLGAKMVEFAGWDMPVQYSGVIAEHVSVRARAGLFDVSHMGEIIVRGENAMQFCQRLTTNDVSRLKEFQAQYNLLMNDNGGVVDDVIIYRLKCNDFLICVNASNIDKDIAWIGDHANGRVEFENASSQYAQLALQGPLAATILQPLTAVELSGIKSFYFAFSDVAAVRCLVARTGYTGEDGFELYCESSDAEKLWAAVLEAGGPAGLVPVGLGARDTLRLEKAYPLYGHELDDATTPLEAGLEWVVKWEKGPFMGRDVLVKQKQAGVRRKLVGIELLDPGIARSEHPIHKNDKTIGRVTSGTKSPTLGKSIALGYIESEESHVDNQVEVEIRGQKKRAKVVSLPFYRR